MKWFWILGVLLGAGGPVRAQMDSVVICLEKIKTATEDSVRLEYAGEIEYFIRSSAFGSYRTEKPVKYLGYKRSDDAGIELFSWAVPLREGQAFYNLFRFKNPERSYLIKALPGCFMILSLSNIRSRGMYFCWDGRKPGIPTGKRYGWPVSIPTERSLIIILF